MQFFLLDVATHDDSCHAQGLFGLKKVNDFKSEKENVDEDILTVRFPSPFLASQPVCGFAGSIPDKCGATGRKRATGNRGD
jgi:hypothetical protein